MAKLPTVGPFPFGVNNRRPPHDLTQAVGNTTVDLLRDAVNVDISDTGKLRRREGFTQVFEGRAHSAWGDDKAGFYAEGGTLYHLSLSNGGELHRTVIRDDLAPNETLSYCEAGGTYYYASKSVIGMVRGGARLDFTPRPLLTPVLSVTPGAMPKGRYQVCITQFSAAGESASTVPGTIDVPEGGGIRVGSIPPAPVGSITLIYVTGANGEVFGRAAVDIAAGVADILTSSATGASCQTLLTESIPAGDIVRFSNGRLLVARGELLIYSEPFFAGLFRPSKNYIPFSEPITMLEPSDKGIFVAADKTYWFAGEITQASPQEVLPYGAVPGSGGRNPAAPDSCFWISERGLVFGTPDGSVKNLQEEQLALTGGTAGAAVYRERNGQRHVLTSVQDPGRTSAGFGFRFDAEIIQKGVST